MHRQYIIWHLWAAGTASKSKQPRRLQQLLVSETTFMPGKQSKLSWLRQERAQTLLWRSGLSPPYGHRSCHMGSDCKSILQRSLESLSLASCTNARDRTLHRWTLCLWDTKNYQDTGAFQMACARVQAAIVTFCPSPTVCHRLPGSLHIALCNVAFAPLVKLYLCFRSKDKRMCQAAKLWCFKHYVHNRMEYLPWLIPSESIRTASATWLYWASFQGWNCCFLKSAICILWGPHSFTKSIYP